jgi:hypothetical protein
MKMHKKIRLLLIAIVSLIGMSSCETDFSLNGDYEVNPVVFGLLDHHDDFHTIKITKAFLGDGDNLVYSKIPDSNYFNQVDAKIVELKNGDLTGREWILFDTILTNKDTSGVFYAPEQKVYAFYESDLDSSATYQLTVDLEGGAYQVTGETELIDNFKVAGQILFPNYSVIFAPNFVDEDDDYNFWSFTVTEGKNAAMYNYKYTFRYKEYYANGDSAQLSITRNDGDIEQSGSAENPSVQIPSFSGLDFYTWLGETIPVDPNVTRRRFEGLDLRISVAHTDLHQFMQVSEPVTGIAQVQPEYTNLQGGRGLFSSRLVYDVLDFDLNGTSTKELCAGQYTSELLFCSDLPEHVGEFFYCD